MFMALNGLMPASHVSIVANPSKTNIDDWTPILRSVSSFPQSSLTDHRAPETKKTKHAEWKHACSESPRNFKMQAFDSKIMCTVT